MCDKLPYENPRIDKCLVGIIDAINKGGEFKTIASCCGHGVFGPTIVVKILSTGGIMEFFHYIHLKKAKKHRYYRFDKTTNMYCLNEKLEILR